MGDVTPKPTTVAEVIRDITDVRYVTATRRYHDSGKMVYEIHVQVWPSRVEHVENFLTGAGYAVNKGQKTDRGDRIIEAKVVL